VVRPSLGSKKEVAREWQVTKPCPFSVRGLREYCDGEALGRHSSAVWVAHRDLDALHEEPTFDRWGVAGSGEPGGAPSAQPFGSHASRRGSTSGASRKVRQRQRSCPGHSNEGVNLSVAFGACRLRPAR